MQPDSVSIPNSAVAVSVAQNQIIYAGFWRRFVAGFIDILILELAAFIVTPFFGTMSVSTTSIGFNLSGTPAVIVYGLFLLYEIFFVGKFGQTLGKMTLKIKVVKIGTNEAPSYTNAFLREVIGKFISTLVVVGYFWVIWDENKQAWHDKIAGTIVVKT